MLLSTPDSRIFHGTRVHIPVTVIPRFNPTSTFLRVVAAPISSRYPKGTISIFHHAISTAPRARAREELGDTLIKQRESVSDSRLSTKYHE